MKRNATAVWYGNGKDGNGNLTTQSLTQDHSSFTFNSRFSEGKGTNPEELLAAAHASCFVMKLAFVLNEAGFNPEEIETTSFITLENGTIVESHLLVKAKITGISKDGFVRSVKDAEINCPVSRVLNAKITVEPYLNT